MHVSHAQMKTLGRLKKRADFLRVQKSGVKWVARGLILQAADAADNNHPDGPGKRFGVTVTRRLDKSAVARNRMKRRLRAAAYEVLSAHARDGADYVLIGRPETANRLYRDLCRDLRWCLEKTGYGDKSS